MKMKSFGWNGFIDGHNHKKLVKNFKKQNKPTVIIANTIKGKGFLLWKTIITGIINSTLLGVQMKE